MAKISKNESGGNANLYMDEEISIRILQYCAKSGDVWFEEKQSGPKCFVLFIILDFLCVLSARSIRHCSRAPGNAHPKQTPIEAYYLWLKEIRPSLLREWRLGLRCHDQDCIDDCPSRAAILEEGAGLSWWSDTIWWLSGSLLSRVQSQDVGDASVATETLKEAGQI